MVKIMNESYLENCCREDVVKQLFQKQHPDADSVVVLRYGSKDITDPQHYTVKGVFSIPRRYEIYETYKFVDLLDGMKVQKAGWWKWKDIPYDELPGCSEKAAGS